MNIDVIGRAAGKSLLAMEGSSKGCDVDGVVLYSWVDAVAKRLVGTMLSD